MKLMKKHLNLVEIKDTMYEISEKCTFFQLKGLEICEALALRSFRTNILNTISFARLKIIYSSIITPKDLEQLSKSLVKDNLPIPIS